MFYIVGTPIGNLKDITFRAVETLKSCDIILCEDTRTSKRLLKTYDIKTPLLSFHTFNENEREEQVIKKLLANKSVALISDAGMPAICDPGVKIIARCRKENIPVTVIPGPSAITSALSLSGLYENRFQFVGYLEKKEGALREQLFDMLTYKGLSVCYETPHRVLKTLKILMKIAPHSNVLIAREMTKIFEETLLDTPKKLFNHFEKKGVKGEMVLIVSGKEPSLELSPQECLDFLENTFQLSRKEALVIGSKWLKVPKKTLYHTN